MVIGRRLRWPRPPKLLLKVFHMSVKMLALRVWEYGIESKRRQGPSQNLSLTVTQNRTTLRIFPSHPTEGNHRCPVSRRSIDSNTPLRTTVDTPPVQAIRDHVELHRTLTKEGCRSSNNNPEDPPEVVEIHAGHLCRVSGESNTTGGRGESVDPDLGPGLDLDPKGSMGDAHLVKQGSLDQRVGQDHHRNNNNRHPRTEDQLVPGILQRSEGEGLTHLHTLHTMKVTKICIYSPYMEKHELS